jgi:hypothetical protein
MTLLTDCVMAWNPQRLPRGVERDSSATLLRRGIA